ncbi:MAG TPA: ABC transporter permease [Acidimicrobiia bacterium]|nr:ABC transporter permease [Acidimicrobiia bacterium]
MTWFEATRLVAARELRESFRRKSLWIVLAVLFIGSSVAMILPEVLDSGSTRYDVAVVPGADTAASTGFRSDLSAGAATLDAHVRFRTVSDRSLARTLVDQGKVDIAVVDGGQPTVIVRAGENDTLLALVRQSLATQELARQLASAGLDQATIDRVLTTPNARVEEVAADESDRKASAAILSLVLYLVLLLLMIQAANGVAIEKANRISEVLLAVVKPTALFFGKVVGVGLVGLAGLAAGAIPVVVKAVAGGDLPAGLGAAILGGFPWMLLGLVLYLTTAGALGALIERQEEAGAVLTPLSLLLIGTYVLAQSSAGKDFGAVLAIFPFTSPIVMPARIALGDASTAEIVASLLVGIATVLFVVRLGSAIYRRGIVHTGRRLRLDEVLRTS